MWNSLNSEIFQNEKVYNFIKPILLKHFKEVYYINGEKIENQYRLVIKVLGLNHYTLNLLSAKINNIEKKHDLRISLFSNEKEFLNVFITEKNYIRLQRIEKLKKLFYG